MPTIDIKDWNNEKVGSVELSDAVFGYPYKEHLVHEAVRNYLASIRRGTHKTKTRAEFNAMAPVDQMAFIKSGGRIV